MGVFVVVDSHAPPDSNDTAGHTPIPTAADTDPPTDFNASTPSAPSATSSTPTRRRWRRHQPRTVVYANVTPRPRATDRVPAPPATASTAGPITSTASNLPNKQNEGNNP